MLTYLGFLASPLSQTQGHHCGTAHICIRLQPGSLEYTDDNSEQSETPIKSISVGRFECVISPGRGDNGGGVYWDG